MMNDPGFPTQQTTTTVTSSSTTVQTNLRYDPTYLRTVPGIFKCGQMVLNLLIFISVTASGLGYISRLGFMSFICGFGFWLTGVLFAFYLFHVIEKYFKVPWLKIELVYCGLWTLFLLIGSTLCTSYISSGAVFGVVAFFGFIDMILYGYEGFLKFRSLQNGEIAQGERQITKTSSATASPAAY